MEKNIPAFPLFAEEATGDGHTHISFQAGMTLLDYFAGQALTALVHTKQYEGKAENYAHHAYRIAAAMLEARTHHIK